MNDQKLLSVVLAGRNDNYLGDFQYRLATSINLLVQNSVNTQLSHLLEIVVVDWNSTTPLSRELDLTPEAARQTRFIEVPPDLAEQFQEPGETFHGTLAINTGIQRARGEFVMIMPADILVPQASLYILVQILSGKLKTVFDPRQTQFNIPRKLIPWQVTEKRFSPEQWERYLQVASANLKSDSDSYPGLCACMGAILMHHNLWHNCRGFLEILHGWGWSDIELGLRTAQKHPAVNLGSLGVIVFDLQKRPDIETAKTKQEAPQFVATEYALNPDSWGLADHNLQESRVQTTKKHIAETKPSPPCLDLSQLGRTSFANIRKIIPNGQLILTPCERTGLPLLLDTARELVPQTYLDIGASRGYSMALAGHFNPGGEFYGIDDWQQERFFPHKYSPALTSLWLKGTSFQGHLHLLAGNRENALDRLQALIPDQNIKFDLVYFRLDYFEDRALTQADMVLSLLSPGGTIIFITDDHELLLKLESLLAQKHLPGQRCSFNNQALVFQARNDRQTEISEKEKRASQELTAQGEELMARGKAGQGLSCFLKAIELDPNNAPAHNNIAVLYSQNNPSRALHHLNLASRLAPEDQTIRDNLKRLRNSLHDKQNKIAGSVHVPKQLQPAPEFPVYPPYHQGPYLEEFFYHFFTQKNLELKYKYLPIFWTNCYNNGLPREFIQDFLDTLNRDTYYFTVCQHDDAPAERLPPRTIVFSAGGNVKDKEIIPIPLICSPIPNPEQYITEKEFLASFVGSLTHPIRQKMIQTLQGHPSYHLQYKAWSNTLESSQVNNFLKATGKSKYTLCPRGYGPTSFRLYEAMQLHSVPVYISDSFYLPWEDQLDWQKLAVLIPEEDIQDLDKILSRIPEKTYQSLLDNCKKAFPEYFSLTGVCTKIINKLKELS